MSFGESVLYAFFCMVVVFAVLIILWGIIKLFSAFIRLVEKRQ